MLFILLRLRRQRRKTARPQTESGKNWKQLQEHILTYSHMLEPPAKPQSEFPRQLTPNSSKGGPVKPSWRALKWLSSRGILSHRIQGLTQSYTSQLQNVRDKQLVSPRPPASLNMSLPLIHQLNQRQLGFVTPAEKGCFQDLEISQ